MNNMSKFKEVLAAIGIGSTEAKMERTIGRINGIITAVEKAKDSAAVMAENAIKRKQAKIERLEAEIDTLNALVKALD
jgi:hypothetical protein